MRLSIGTTPKLGPSLMPPVVYAFLSMLGVLLRSQLHLRAENVALRHQLAIYQRTVKRPIIRPEDRILWSWLSRRWARWRDVLVFVRPETVIAWQRKRFRDHWARLSRVRKPGRPRISTEIRELIRTISGADPLWSTPRIVGELGKLGITVAKVRGASAVSDLELSGRRGSRVTGRRCVWAPKTDKCTADEYANNP